MVQQSNDQAAGALRAQVAELAAAQQLIDELAAQSVKQPLETPSGKRWPLKAHALNPREIPKSQMSSQDCIIVPAV